MSDEELKLAGIAFAKQNKKRIAVEQTDIAKYPPDEIPISVFMAGSPGAGKTEFSKNLIGILEKQNNHSVVRIDGDEIRALIPGYTGNNSHLFQGAISTIVDKVHDLVLEQKQTFVLDGTFSRYEKATANINRSLAKKRDIMIFYVYQKPETAWKFTQEREKIEGRNIPKDAFIEQFLDARKVVERIRSEFGDEVAIILVKKDFERNTVDEVVEINPGGKPIADYLERDYSKEDLEKIL